VFTVDCALTSVANFLRTIEIVPRGAVILFDNNGEPIAGVPGPGRDAVTRAFEDWTRTRTVMNEREGAPTTLMRFTEIDWDTQARIETFAHWSRNMT